MVCSIAYAENRLKALEADADIYITNIDAVKWMMKNMPKAFFRKFDTIIIDELTGYKHGTSQRSKAVRKMVQLKVGGQYIFEYREGLTGTPNSGSITEIWHQALIIDDGRRLGTSFFNFRNAVCSPEQIGPQATHVKWVDKPGSEQAVAGLLSDISIRHAFEDCMDIPPNHSFLREYTIPAKLMRQYLDMQAEQILQSEKGVVTAINAAVLRNKLLQILSGAVYTDPEDDNTDYVLLDAGRYEYVIDLATEVDHSIIFFNWRHQHIEMCRILEDREIKYAVINGDVPIAHREVIVAKFQAGYYQTLLLHPQTGAHGITLTKGTRSVWASATSQPDIYKQGKHRIYRGGQTLATENIMVAAAGTIETKVYETWEARNANMVSFLDFIHDKD